ncbi:MAG: ATP-binding protein [Acidobacteriota bacterium]
MNVRDLWNDTQLWIPPGLGSRGTAPAVGELGCLPWVVPSNLEELLAILDRTEPAIAILNLRMWESAEALVGKFLEASWPVPFSFLACTDDWIRIIRQIEWRQDGRFAGNVMAELLNGLLDLQHLAVEGLSRESVKAVLSDGEARLVLGNRLDQISVLTGFVADLLAAQGVSQEASGEVRVALQEAVVNAVVHGNLECSGEPDRSNGHALESLIVARRQDQSLRERRVYVHFTYAAREVRCVVRDEGPGFDPKLVHDPTESEGLEQLGGRGVWLMKALMDEVRYSESGNEVTMVKRMPTNKE